MKSDLRRSFGSTRRLTQRISVDLPAPLGPMIAKKSSAPEREAHAFQDLALGVAGAQILHFQDGLHWRVLVARSARGYLPPPASRITS